MKGMGMKKFLIGMVVLAALAGCNTFKGLGEDIQRGGEAIEKAASK
jgi:predicted small secreted protein